MAPSIARPSRSSAAGAARACRSTPARSPSRSSRSAAGRSSWHVDRALRRPGLPPLPARHRLPRRADRALRRRRALAGGVSQVECLDTGLDTPTGGRIKLLEPALAERDHVLRHLRRRPRRHRPRAAARLPRAPRRARHDDRRAARAAVRDHRARRRDGRVLGFREKPRSEHWINGGFFCLRAGVLRLSAGRQRARARSRWRSSPPPGSCAPTATRASGSAWTPTRTPSRSTTCGPPGQAPWRMRSSPTAAPGSGPRWHDASRVAGREACRAGVRPPRRIPPHDRPRHRPRARQRRLRRRRAPPRPARRARRRRDRHARRARAARRAWPPSTSACWS